MTPRRLRRREPDRAIHFRYSRRRRAYGEFGSCPGCRGQPSYSLTNANRCAGMCNLVGLSSDVLDRAPDVIGRIEEHSPTGSAPNRMSQVSEPLLPQMQMTFALEIVDHHFVRIGVLADQGHWLASPQAAEQPAPNRLRRAARLEARAEGSPPDRCRFAPARRDALARLGALPRPA